MARTLLTSQAAVETGLAATYTAADGTNGNTYVLVPHRLLHVKNGSASAITVTITTPLTVNGLAVADRTISIAAGADQFISLNTSSAYMQPDGTAWVDYSAAASVTVAVIDA